MMEVTTIFIAVILLAVVAAQFIQTIRNRLDSTVSVALQNLAQTIEQTHTQAAVLSGKIESLDGVPALMGKMQVEVRGFSERLANVEQNQSTVSSGVNSLQTSVAQAATVADNIVDVTKVIRSELTK